MPRYLIGIDLGTTNSALAYIDRERKPRSSPPRIETFPVPQLIAPGEMGTRELLPSFLYLPGEHDLPPGSAALPWDAGRSAIVGAFAHQHGSRVPGRLVTSAKSWLCHAGVDRKAPLLPWSAPPDVSRISPVEASARYLKHLVEAWNHAMAADRPEDRLEKQAVVLTVPASFDDVARTLTVEAAREAGLENLTLLEEPQAAFYCWLATHPPTEAAQLKPGMRCVVIDVGGGTSDFSLIEAGEQQGGLNFLRQAVGDHLLLGGDNMDLALAKFVETRLPQAGKLDAAQYSQLTQACRLAKEKLLGPDPPAGFPVTVVGRGRSIVAGTQSTSLTADDVRRLLCDGFFPAVPVDAEPQRGARTGLHEMGLPYVSDPAITRHLAAFLRHQADRPPAALLFNGGVFQAAPLREQLVNVMRGWYGDSGWEPLVLTNPSLDLAVSFGAAYYAWLKDTGGRRIGGGMARSYYVAVDSGTAPDGDAPLTVVCVVPRHLEEGQEITLEQPELELALGQPVLFPLYTSTVRADDHAGDVLQVSPEQLLQLPPLHTVLRGGKRSGTRRVPVHLAAKSTEVGTLELWCVAREGDNRWRLEFNVRDQLREEPARGEGDGEPATVTDVWLEDQVQKAGDLIRATYRGEEGAPAPNEVTRALEAALDASRSEWPTGLCRRLWDFLAEVSDNRRRTPAHTIRWYHLAGYCLRPGMGDPRDRFRVEQLWKIVQTPPRPEPGKVVSRQPESGADYWIMWRRVSAGLPAPLQNALFDRLRPVLLQTKGSVKPTANELVEMWRAAASLERLDVKHKEAMGEQLLKPIRKGQPPVYAFHALTRLGARVLLYGPLNAVVHPQIAGRWLEAIVGFEPTHVSEQRDWAFCLAMLARRSGQRALDLDDSHRATVLTLLRGQADIPPTWVRMVEEVCEPEGEEQSKLFGESMPIGLRLVRSE